MLTLLLWRKVSDFAADSFTFHCISRRQLVSVDVESGPGFISISPHTEAEVGAAVPASVAPPPKWQFDE